MLGKCVIITLHLHMLVLIWDGKIHASLHGKTKPTQPSAWKDDCKGNSICVLPVQCPAHVLYENLQACHSISGRPAVCCTSGQNHTGPLQEKDREHLITNIDSQTLNTLSRRSRAEVAELHLREAQLLNDGRSTLSRSSASYGHFKNSRLFSLMDLTQVVGVAGKALEIAVATRTFKHRQGITNKQLEMGMIKQNLKHTPLGGSCANEPSCLTVSSRYRRIDGACNNVLYSAWGARLSPYARLLPPSYQDGIWSPRVSKWHEQPLSSPRLVSTTLFSDLDVPDENYTLMVMQFGQYLAHEITQSIDISFSNGSAVSCCTHDGTNELPHRFRHYACMPINLPPSDPFYREFKQGCMNFVRSVLAPGHDCSLGYAQQMNKVTHFIDGSSIYGSTPEQTQELRLFRGGRLKTFRDFGRDLLPLAKDKEACMVMEEGSACFESGDTRTNQLISLVAVHTVFLREHNRIAKELAKLNPHWPEDTLFQETRRIIAAVLQVIVYKEFLPAVLGKTTMEEFQIGLNNDDLYSHDYDPYVNPSVTNEFTTAAFRFGHSTVDGLLRLYGRTKMEEAVCISETMFQPSRFRKRQFLDEILSTLTSEPMQQVDNSISDELTRYLFHGGSPFGVDLAAINVQRGRDHGIRPYNDYRVLSGQNRIYSFDEFGRELGEKLRKIYTVVDDMDLWVGGLLESKAPGSIMGITFRDIIADQFHRLRVGDRYFFDKNPTINPGYFTREQIRELKKASMSRLICDNSDSILLARQAPNAFKKPGVPGNEFVDCAGPEIPRINLLYWREYL